MDYIVYRLYISQLHHFKDFWLTLKTEDNSYPFNVFDLYQRPFLRNVYLSSSRVNWYRRKRPKVDASSFDSALSHTRRLGPVGKKEKNSVSTFGRFRLWTSLDFSPVSGKISKFQIIEYWVTDWQTIRDGLSIVLDRSNNVYLFLKLFDLFNIVRSPFSYGCLTD